MKYTTEMFATENKSKKVEVESTITKLIRSQLNANQRNNGIRIYSLTGPNIKRHVEQYQCLFGRLGSLVSFEEREDVYEIQKLTTHKQLKIRLGDFWQEVAYDLKTGSGRRPSILYLDFDACKTLRIMAPQIESSIRRITPVFTQHTIWFSLTFCQKDHVKGSFKEEDALHHLKWAWISGGYSPTLFLEFPYSDGMPMKTVLWRLERSE